MDPITLLAAVTAAYNGVKKAVEIGQEVENVYGELSKWAGHVGNLQDAIRGIEEGEKKPSIWKKITFEKSDTAEAFDVYTAKQKLREMEKEIREMFLYGELSHLGMDGYNEFREMRRAVREKRTKILLEQQEEREKFLENIKIITISGVTILSGTMLLWLMIDFAFNIK